MKVFLYNSNYLIYLILLLSSSVILGQSSTSGGGTDCIAGSSIKELNVNNVRAALRQSGSMFYKNEKAAYQVPKLSEGEDGPSSIFAAGVWFGGLQNESFKIAAVQYGLDNGETDWFPGPLDDNGEIQQADCANWDQHFEVLGDDITALRDRYMAQSGNIVLSDVPTSILAWPAHGNPYFSQINGFSLPDRPDGLAPFYDRNGDAIYDPLDGDYPIIGLVDASSDAYADQMIFWIFNDNGSYHVESYGDQMRVEVHQMSFAFKADNAINDMTFHKYTFVNRAVSPIDSAFFGFWYDADLGCSEDDYFGCSVSDNLAYLYNSDDVDGTDGCICSLSGGDTPTYCNDVPMLGVGFLNVDMSVFRALRTPNGQHETYPSQYYAQLTGSDFFGTPARNPITNEITTFDYTDPPTESNGWSACTEDPAPEIDPRLIQSTGPFTLAPRERKVVFMGIYHTPSIMDYPCPSLDPILAADSLADDFFNRGFDSSGLLNSVSNLSQIDATIYPNPVYDLLYIQVDNIKSTAYNVLLYNIQGVLISSDNIVGSDDGVIDISSLPAGTYLIQVTSKEGVYSERFVKM